MSKIESRVGKIANSDEKIFTFLSDFNNFEKLIPEDKVKNWQSDKESCSFTVDGVGSAGLKIVEKEPFQTIKIASAEGTPLNFMLWIQLKKLEENDTRVKITIEPKVNAMMMPMIKGPLKNFVDMLVEQMEKLSFV